MTTRKAKLQILDNAWFKFLGRLQHEQLEIGDKFTKILINRIVMIDPKYRIEALSQFLKCSHRVHSIAFMQWRKQFCKTKTNISQLEQVISDQMKFMYGDLEANQYIEPLNKFSVEEEYYMDKYNGVIDRAKSY